MMGTSKIISHIIHFLNVTLDLPYLTFSGFSTETNEFKDIPEPAEMFSTPTHNQHQYTPTHLTPRVEGRFRDQTR